MSIVHVVDSFAPTVGGIERAVEVLSARQALDRPTAVLTARRRPAGDRPDRPVVSTRRYDRAGLARALVDLDADTVHVHVSVVSPLAHVAALAAADLDLPVVVTVHSLWDHAHPPAFVLGGLRRPGVVWSAVSTVAADHVRRVLRGTDVRVLPNVVDRTAWSVDRTVPPDDDAPLRLLAVGRLAAIKRVGRLVDAVGTAWHRSGRRPEFVLDVVGDGRQRPRVERAVARTGLADHIRVWGALEPAQVRERLAAADLFVAPAPREAFGIAALEARASGLPVLGYADAGVHDFVRHGEDGFLARTGTELTAWLTAVFDDPVGRLRPLQERAARTPVTLTAEEAAGRVQVAYRDARLGVAPRRGRTVGRGTEDDVGPAGAVRPAETLAAEAGSAGSAGAVTPPAFRASAARPAPTPRSRR